MVSGGGDGRDRDKGTSHLGAFGYITAIVLSCLIVGFFAFLEGYQSERNQNSPYEYSQAAKRNASIACRDREPAAVADCIYDEITSAREKSEAEQDLNAQQWMARWAGILVIITLATTLISWFALRYLRDTFIQTREAVKETAKATKAMRKANKIARRSNERQIRAYVAAIKATISVRALVGKQRDFVDIVINNKGNTPAKLTKMMVYVAHTQGKKNTVIFKKTVPLQTGLSGQSGNATIPVCINHVPEKDIYLGEYEAGVFVIGGSIEYTDIFNGFRSIKFTFSTTDNFWKDYPNDAHECTVLDQGFEAA